MKRRTSREVAELARVNYDDILSRVRMEEVIHNATSNRFLIKEALMELDRKNLTKRQKNYLSILKSSLLEAFLIIDGRDMNGEYVVIRSEWRKGN